MYKTAQVVLLLRRCLSFHNIPYWLVEVETAIIDVHSRNFAIWADLQTDVVRSLQHVDAVTLQIACKLNIYFLS